MKNFKFKRTKSKTSTKSDQEKAVKLPPPGLMLQDEQWGPYELSASLDRPFELAGDFYYPSTEKEIVNHDIYPTKSGYPHAHRPEVFHDCEESQLPETVPVPWQDKIPVAVGHAQKESAQETCNTCGSAFQITQIRIKCSICIDHQLCSDCQMRGKFLPPHSALHPFTLIDPATAPVQPPIPVIPQTPSKTQPSVTGTGTPSGSGYPSAPTSPSEMRSPQSGCVSPVNIKFELDPHVNVMTTGRRIASDDVEVKDYLDRALGIMWHSQRVKPGARKLSSAVDQAVSRFGLKKVTHWAARNNVMMLLSIIGDKEKLQTKDMNNWTPLHWACFSGSLDVVRYLVKVGVDLDAKTLNLWTGTHLAVRGGHESIVRYLCVDSNSSTSEHDCNHYTPMQWAVKEASFSMIELCIEHMGAWDYSTLDMQSTLHLAVRRGDYQILETLLENGAVTGDIDDKNFCDETPIHEAVNLGRVDILELLMTKTENLGQQNDEGESALHIAVRKNLIDIVDALGKRVGDNIHDRNLEGKTPLQVAVELDYYEVARSLVKNGASTKVSRRERELVLDEMHGVPLSRTMNMLLAEARKNEESWSILEVADETYPQTPAINQSMEVLRYIDEEVKDEDSDILYAAAAGDTGLMSESLKRYKGSRGRSELLNRALFKAARVGDRQNIELLLMHGASMEAFSSSHNSSNRVEWTALHAAAASGHKDIVTLFCYRSKGAINSWHNNHDNANDATPLQVAAYHGNLATVETLLEHGASVLVADNYSSFKAALANNQLETAEFILSRGALQAEGTERLLRHAAQHRSKEMVSLLINEYHVNVDAAIGENNETALCIICSYLYEEDKRVETIKILLDAGADIHLGSPIKLALAYGPEHPKMAKLLIERGASIAGTVVDVDTLEVRHTRYKYPVHELKLAYAVGVGDRGWEPKLVEAWERALKNGTESKVEELLKIGPGIDFRLDRWGTTPLRYFNEGQAPRNARIKAMLERAFANRQDS